MKYQDMVKLAMDNIAQVDNSVFIGYNLKYGSKMYGSMKDVPEDKIYEMPTAEQLMTGMATGMAIAGYLPVLIFERMDFMLLAADQIVNHLDKISELSGGQFNPKVIIRAVVGHDKPFNPGIQHLQDYTDMFRSVLHNAPVKVCNNGGEAIEYYAKALISKQSTIIVEKKGLYQ